MFSKTTLLLLSMTFFIFCATYASAERYGEAAYTFVLRQEKISKYKAIAKTIGFELLKKYSYTEYAEIKRENELGISGNYEWLILSTGGTEANFEDWQRFSKQECGWETIYYSNHDLTVIHEECRTLDMATKKVRILKVAKGRRPNLYKE